MPNINITVAGKIATNTSPGIFIVCGNSDYNITFSFDSEWNGMEERTARFLFYKQGRSWFTDVTFTGDTVQVPVMSGVDFVLVGAYAGNLRTTTPARVLCSRSILCDDATELAAGPTREKLERLIAEVEQQLASGAFIGPAGPAGPQGPAGERGADGTGVTILGSFSSEESLSAAHPTGNIGDAYMVGGNLYVWSATAGGWENVGSIQGPQGERGETGPRGPAGERGADGTGVTILGSFETVEELSAVHPTGNIGDAYLVGGNLYVWSATAGGWENVGSIQGPQGERGETGPRGPAGERGADGTSATHSWNGTTLTVTSASGTSSANLKGDKGDKGDTGSAGSSGKDGVSVTHSWSGTKLIITSASGTSAVDLKGDTGSKGDKGDTGAAGYSPVRGTDYWTDADIAEIKSYVDNAILGGAW